ncbi:sensor domain-containing diguanylate cyclase [Jeotgalibaca sp. A122]|uniref:sensor domain-containing diguanylate cyclase n=1 Tax=Jeotgalibaca sp. A122 TaxID=3457322 RepID=UPI003FCF0AF6
MNIQHKDILKENAYLKRLNKELLEQIFHDDFTQFPWLGNLGRWFWDVSENVVTFNPLKSEAIGYSRDELPDEIGFEFFTEKLHPEDYDHVMDLMTAHLKGEAPVWEVKYRIKAKDGSWKVFYDRGLVTKRDAEGKPLFLSGNVFDVTVDAFDRQESIQKTRYWKQQAQYDRLTNLYSRKELERQLHIIEKNGENYSLMVIDIDYFKNINDSYGHLAGDSVLKQIGGIIKSCARETDISGRFGGDEFIIAFPQTTKEQAHAVSLRLQDEIDDLTFDLPSKPTLSIGIASRFEADDFTGVFELADNRLYQAKNAGRNQVVFK